MSWMVVSVNDEPLAKYLVRALSEREAQEIVTEHAPLDRISTVMHFADYCNKRGITLTSSVKFKAGQAQSEALILGLIEIERRINPR